MSGSAATQTQTEIRGMMEEIFAPIQSEAAGMNLADSSRMTLEAPSELVGPLPAPEVIRGGPFN